MPCRYDGDESPSSTVQAELDKLTRLLCEACRWSGSKNPVSNWSPELKDWWSSHKKADELRAKQELEEERQREIVRVALTKLSKEEREALGFPKPPSREVLRSSRRLII